MKVEILTIGDEVVRGEIVDSNKALIAQRLLGLDLECQHQVSLRDDPADMRAAFKLAIERSDVVIVSGGLGPTRDDLTTEVLAETLGRELELDDDSLEQMKSFFARVGREMAETNRKQAFFPTGSDILKNPVGTAPGFSVEENGTVFFCLPGVPRELSLMLEEQVLPRVEARLESLGSVTRIRARLLRTFGVGESTLEKQLSTIAREGDVELAFRTSFPDNFLRVMARGASIEAADVKIESVVQQIHEHLGDLVYAEGEERMEEVVGGLLTEQGRTVALAESCTGGLIAEKLTDVPGSSAYFLGGVVAYANSAKEAILGVPSSLLEEHGAVSSQVARSMAEGVCKRFGADIGVSTTGISGPGGGSPEKPVGLVHVAMYQRPAEGRHETEGFIHSSEFIFPLDRTRHRVLTTQTVLDWLRRRLLGVELIDPDLLRTKGGSSAPGLGGTQKKQ
ncbi:MAG: competence/damage-inducible protein A [Deltaproteobacteria bacterium]|nr:competence/damage-inducible protein A [Deltaproteobacteria bacterium]